MTNHAIQAAEAVIGQMLHSPLQNYIAPGLTSFLCGGEAHGKIRVLHSDRDQREFITPHSHRFDFACIVISGVATNVIYERAQPSQETNAFAVGTLKRKQEFGDYEFCAGEGPSHFREIRSTYEAGSFYAMTADQIHSIYFTRGATILFLEGPEVSPESVVLEPWSNGRRVPTFETREWMFQRAKARP
jgi:hypothetical protein